jgi:hypothetical protein
MSVDCYARVAISTLPVRLLIIGRKSLISSLGAAFFASRCPQWPGSAGQGGTAPCDEGEPQFLPLIKDLRYKERLKPERIFG